MKSHPPKPGSLQPPHFSHPPEGEDRGPVSRSRQPVTEEITQDIPLPVPEPAGYAELHCLSDFSFQRGASSARELFTRAASQGYAALAITDECSLAGIVRALQASENTVPLIVGSEFRLADGLTLVLLVENQTGYTELCRLITLGRMRCDKGSYRLEREDLENLGSGLMLLWLPSADALPSRRNTISELTSANAGDFAQNTAPSNVIPLRRERKKAGFIDLCDSTGLDSKNPLDLTPDLNETARWIVHHFAGRAWIAAELHRGPNDAADLNALRALGERFQLPLVAAGGVHMHERRRRSLQDVMTAIRLGCTVAQAGSELFPNGERHLRSARALRTIYPQDLRDETLKIAARCRFNLRKVRYEYPHELVPKKRTAIKHLYKLTWRGAEKLWPGGIPEKIQKTLVKELNLIAYCEYEHFFLTVADIVDWAKSRPMPILCQGRGSAANSAVCFCLGITSVNPESAHLLFERFVSKEREESPDIDVDFEHERREEVLQYVFDKYGRERTALAATVITWQAKSAVRGVGAALGLSQDQLDHLSRIFMRGNGSESLSTLMAEQGLAYDNPQLRTVLKLSGELLDMPRHLSQHVGGFVISQYPLNTLVPTENAAMEKRTVIQWDKDDLEYMDLLKVDCLALGMLTCLRKCFDLLRTHHCRDLNLQTVPQDDDKTYKMICEADTIGVFQIESRAQMSMLPRLKPQKFYDIVVEVAIVRPGPIQGGMVHPYLRRREGKEEVRYPKKELEAVLERTLGVPLFQEQVMHLLQVAAKFTPGESDQLRRSMAAWKRNGGLEHFESLIKSRMIENGYTEEFADQIFQQILGFGSYGFPESHATGFAQLAYVSSWLKCHYPAAFACALLNSQPMGFYAPAQIIQDVRRHDVEVRAVDVTASDWDSTLEKRPDGEHALRLGLRLITGLAEGIALRIVEARRTAAYQDVADLTRRAHLDREMRERLASAGALRSLAGHRHRAHWDSAGAELPTPLLHDAHTRERRVELSAPTLRADVMHDYARQGFSLECHPLALVRVQLREKRIQNSAELLGVPNGRYVRSAGLVTVRQAPPTAKGAVFITLEDEHGAINIVVWDAVAKQHRRVLLDAVLLGVDGEWQSQSGVCHVIAKRLHDYSGLMPELGSQSRDFH
jgi:error-prone DNA polymerase